MASAVRIVVEGVEGTVPGASGDGPQGPHRQRPGLSLLSCPGDPGAERPSGPVLLVRALGASPGGTGPGPGEVEPGPIAFLRGAGNGRCLAGRPREAGGRDAVGLGMFRGIGARTRRGSGAVLLEGIEGPHRESIAPVAKTRPNCSGPSKPPPGRSSAGSRNTRGTCRSSKGPCGGRGSRARSEAENRQGRAGAGPRNARAHRRRRGTGHAVLPSGRRLCQEPRARTSAGPESVARGRCAAPDLGQVVSQSRAAPAHLPPPGGLRSAHRDQVSRPRAIPRGRSR